MTFTNTDTINQSIAAFRRLPIVDQLSILASIYPKIQQSTPAISGTSEQKEIHELINQIKQMREEDHVQFLQDVLSENAAGNRETALDPHPSKALLELIPGGVTPPLEQYQKLSKDAQMSFWYQFAQSMRERIPSNLSLSPAANQILSSLDTNNVEQLMMFLRGIL